MIREYKRNGIEIPELVKNKPEPKPEFCFYLNAFFELSNDRQQGWSLSAIPFSSIAIYAEMMNIKKEDFPFFLDIIRSLDSSFLRLHREKDNGGKSA